MTILLGRGYPRRGVFFCIVALLFLLVLYQLGIICIAPKEQQVHVMHAKEKYLIGPNDQKVYPYDRNMPLIFIGGVPRSGTTLMRAMMDAHPEVRCGQETRIIPRILQMRSHWLKSERESVRLEEAGVTKEVMDSAIAAFCLEVIARHGEPAPRLCNKDPLTLKMGSYVLDLFPNAKFIFMIRDGRATVHSIISRKVTITGFDLSSYRQCMIKWNQAISIMYKQCKELGPERCLAVPYEQLVLHPREWMHRILAYLDVPWNESVLHHEQYINKPGGVLLSNKMQFNTNSSDESSDEEEVARNFEKEAQLVIEEKCLPQKSFDRYNLVYNAFIKWTKENKANSFEESVLICYFKDLLERISPSTAWSVWSILRKMLQTKHDVDMKKYFKLKDILKINSKGYKPKKSSILTWDNITDFMNNAPDLIFLVTKVLLIFGICGALRDNKFVNMKISHVEDWEAKDKFLISVIDTKMMCIEILLSDHYFIPK